MLYPHPNPLTGLATVLARHPWSGTRYLMSSPTTHSTSLRCILWWTRLCPPLLTGRGFSRPWSGKCCALQRPSSLAGSEPLQPEKIIMSSAEWGSLKRRSSAPQITGHGIFTLPLKETLSHTIISFLLHHTDTMEAKQFALSPMFVQVRKEHNHIYNMIPSVSLSDGLFEFSKRNIQNVLFCSGITLYFPEFIKLSSFSKSRVQCG